MYFLHKVGIFHCHVSLQEGKRKNICFSWKFHCSKNLCDGYETTDDDDIWLLTQGSRHGYLWIKSSNHTATFRKDYMNIHTSKLSFLTDASTAWPRSPCAFSLKTLLLFIPGYIFRIHASTQVFHRPQGPWSFGFLLCDLSDENKIQNLCPTVPPNELVHGRWNH